MVSFHVAQVESLGDKLKLSFALGSINQDGRIDRKKFLDFFGSFTQSGPTRTLNLEPTGYEPDALTY